MTNQGNFFSIKSFEWLTPTGDGSKILILYCVADDDQGIKNLKDLSVVINLSRNAEMKLINENATLANKNNQIKVIIEFLRSEIKDSIIKGDNLAKEITITSYTNLIQTNPDLVEFRLGEWEGVNNVRKMGFLST
jgi:hypothetical protein